jgi:undecaprenyl-diphosphatase
LNQFAQRSYTADSLTYLISGNILLKGGSVTAVLWWAWFREGETKIRDREFILCGISIAVVALFVARALAFLLPFRERPLNNPALHFRLPFGVHEKELIGWSSFPSDHAVLYFALATCIYFVSRRAGIMTFCYSFLVVLLPRVYLGFHYPTDVAAGGFLGVSLACLAQVQSVRTLLTSSPMRWLDRSPASFYAWFFLVTLLTATNFGPLREICVSSWYIASGVIHHLP